MKKQNFSRTPSLLIATILLLSMVGVILFVNRTTMTPSSRSLDQHDSVDLDQLTTQQERNQEVVPLDAESDVGTLVFDELSITFPAGTFILDGYAQNYSPQEGGSESIGMRSDADWRVSVDVDFQPDPNSSSEHPAPSDCQGALTKITITGRSILFCSTGMDQDIYGLNQFFLDEERGVLISIRAASPEALEEAVAIVRTQVDWK